MSSSDPVSISELLSVERVHVNLPATSKEDVINLMVEMLEGHPCISDLEQIRSDIFDREAMMSTGVGKGLALPHAKTTGVSETIGSFAVTARPIDFDAMDNQPVRLVFLLAGPEAARSQHIKLLSHISKLMNKEQLRKEVLACDQASEVLEIFAEAEKSFES